MNAEIENYKAKIQFLEKKVLELEKSNSNLSTSLQHQYQFSSKVANIIFDMDCLLTKKNNEIAHLNPYPRFFGTITERVFWKKIQIHHW